MGRAVLRGAGRPEVTLLRTARLTTRRAGLGVLATTRLAARCVAFDLGAGRRAGVDDRRTDFLAGRLALRAGRDLLTVRLAGRDDREVERLGRRAGREARGVERRVEDRTERLLLLMLLLAATFIPP